MLPDDCSLGRAVPSLLVVSVGWFVPSLLVVVVVVVVAAAAVVVVAAAVFHSDAPLLQAASLHSHALPLPMICLQRIGSSELWNHLSQSLPLTGF